jgi:hypothetical protein|tara:strand:- start:528 stop:710 length:183 start_codon:yes stop_codon:yes gene_type:complete
LDKASKKSKGPVDPTKKKGAKKGGQAASGGMPQPVYPGNVSLTIPISSSIADGLFDYNIL